MHFQLLPPIASLKRNPPLKWNLSMTGNLLCFKLYRTHVIYEKAGLNTIQYTFNEDKTCSYTIKGKKVEGTYEFDAEAKTVTIVAGKLKVKTTAHIVTLGSNMSFVFDADKILSVVKTITGVTSGLNKSASAVNKLLEQFDGMMVGFELKKQ